MITDSRGNLLAADVDALVNTVNTVGVMGKGIALQFKRAYPEMFTAYQKAAKAGEIERGQMHVWPTGSLAGPRYVINFPTKGHWRSPSRLPDIKSGLQDLVQVVRALEIRSIAIPPLGAGNGGLDWRLVEPLIRQAFVDLPNVDVRLYAPAGAPRASEMPVATSTPRMTPGRAALIQILARYLRATASASPIEVQKLMYFLQEAGQPLRLRFEQGRYGPYADNLRHVLTAVEGHYLTGYGDGSSQVLDSEPIEILAGAEEASAALVNSDAAMSERVERVVALTEGFESMYSMELLASVHWTSKLDNAARSDPAEAARLVQGWTPRKRDLFSDRHVAIAWEALRNGGWLTAA